MPHPHRLLLRAAVAPAATAAAALAEWAAATPITRADPDETTVLPLLASRLTELAPAPAVAQRLRGLRRHAVVRQFVVREELTAAAGLLRAQGIEPIAVKGVALAAAYGSERCRAVGDADVLVPPEQRVAAVAALTAGGFAGTYGIATEDVTLWAGRFHALGMHRPERPDVDLHWRLPHQPAEADRLTAIIRRRARPAGGDPWLLPNTAHQLAIAVAHGWATISQASLRMLVDVAVLLQDPEVVAAVADEVLGPHHLRAALDHVLDLLAAEEVPGAAAFRTTLPRPRHSDRLVARTLLADRDGLATRLAWAAAQRRPSALRPASVQSLPLHGPVAPPAEQAVQLARIDPANDAHVGLAGQGWWLPDGWATWSRRRVASLRLAPAPRGTVTRLRVALPPGTPSHRRWTLVIGGGRVAQVCRPTTGGQADVVLRGGRRAWFLSPGLCVPAEALGTGDRRRLGVAVTAISTSGGEGVHHEG